MYRKSLLQLVRLFGPGCGEQSLRPANDWRESSREPVLTILTVWRRKNSSAAFLANPAPLSAILGEPGKLSKRSISRLRALAELPVFGRGEGGTEIENGCCKHLQ